MKFTYVVMTNALNMLMFPYNIKKMHTEIAPVKKKTVAKGQLTEITI